MMNMQEYGGFITVGAVNSVLIGIVGVLLWNKITEVKEEIKKIPELMTKKDCKEERTAIREEFREVTSGMRDEHVGVTQNMHKRIDTESARANEHGERLAGLEAVERRCKKCGG
jgi:hypothetical protein